MSTCPPRTSSIHSASTSGISKPPEKQNPDEGQSHVPSVLSTFDTTSTSGKIKSTETSNPDRSPFTTVTSGNTKQVEIINPDNGNQYKQSDITTYLCTPQSLISRSTPGQPQKSTNVLVFCPSGINLNTIFHSKQLDSSPSHPKGSITAPQWRQSSLTDYFRLRGPTVLLPRLSPRLPAAPQPLAAAKKPKSVRHALNNYRKAPRRMPKITRYTIHMPSYDLFESWGHSLEVIDPNSTFRIFLQNPNGLPISPNNQLLLQDFQTCYNYGAGMLCLPETNTNWNQGGQLSTLNQLFHRIWRTSSVQVSQTPDPFLANRQPGGTMTAVCENWVSRVISKGEDPFGLGRWSYITMRGTENTKITVITAYNATPSPGECTYYHQQMRVLSRLHREQSILASPDPRRQFILDLQSWI